MKYLNRVIFKLFYGIEFDKAYEYTGWRCGLEMDSLFQMLHNAKIDCGWEQHSNLIFYFGKAVMIYRRPLNTGMNY